MNGQGLHQDPQLEVLPDHAGPHYDDIRRLLIGTGLTLEQVVQALNNSWNLRPRDLSTREMVHPRERSY
jgi:hypothetical protein